MLKFLSFPCSELLSDGSRIAKSFLRGFLEPLWSTECVISYTLIFYDNIKCYLYFIYIHIYVFLYLARYILFFVCALIIAICSNWPQGCSSTPVLTTDSQASFQTAVLNWTLSCRSFMTLDLTFNPSSPSLWRTF